MEVGTSGTDTSSAQSSGSEGQQEDTGTGAYGADGVASEGSTESSESAKAAAVRELKEQDLDSVVSIKVNGQDRRMSVRDAIKKLQLGEATEENLSHAKQARQKVMELAYLAKNDPERFFEITGVDPEKLDQMSEARLAKKLQLLSESPTEKQARMDREDAERFRQFKQKQVEAEKQAQMSQAEQVEITKLDQEFARGFKAAGLPADKYLAQLAAVEMLSSEKRGQPLSAESAAAKVKERFVRNTRGTLENLDINQIQEILGPKVLKQLREAEIGRVSQAAPTLKSAGRPQGAKPAPQGNSNQTTRQGLSEKEWRAWWSK